MQTKFELRYIVLSRLLIFGVVILFTLLLHPNRAQAQATGQFLVKYVPNCPNAGQTTLYTNIDAAVKDTIPNEWWGNLGLANNSNPPYSMLQAASVMVRSRIIFEDLKTPHPNIEDFTSPSLDNRGAVNSSWNQSVYPFCQTSRSSYTMNTVLGASGAYGGLTNYQSNAATNSTSGQYILDISGAVNQVAFNPAIQQRSASCAEQSDDWKFCSISALAADLSPITGANNRYSRRLNTTPINKIRFEAEAFVNRVVRTDSWFCYTNVGDYRNKCFMQAVPDDGNGFASNENYLVNSSYMEYDVAFPTTASSTWYVWVRGYGCGFNSDSLHMRIYDPQGNVSAAEDMTGWNACAWQWWSVKTNNQRAILIAATDGTNQWAAFKKLQIYMREDGMRIDRVVLVKDDANYNPANDPWATGY